MPPIDDLRLAQIYATNACPDLPAPVVKQAHRLIRLLLAAASWSDIGVFTKVAQLPNERYAAPVYGRWAISFAWDDARSGIAFPKLERL